MDTSFSLRVGQNINGGNGYGIEQAVPEEWDNSWDAGSNIVIHIATPYNETYGKSFFLTVDLGRSTPDPRSILGVGREIKKKSDGDIGLKIAGAFNSLCRYNPNEFHAFCKVPSAPEVKIMSYDFGDHVRKINEIMEHGSRDYRDVDRWMDEAQVVRDAVSYRNDISDHPVIQEVINTIQNDKMKGILRRIISGGESNYSLFLRVYNGPLPADIPEGIYNTLTLGKMFYYKQLMMGKEIMYLAPDNTLHHRMAADAINPLGDIIQFPWVRVEMNVYELPDGICLRAALHIEDSRGISAASKIFYITDSQELIADGRKKLKVIIDGIAWPQPNSVNRGEMSLRISCISQAAQNAQKMTLGVGVDSLRGLYCDYNRILGLPYWNSGKDSWGYQRNSSGIRAVLSFTTQYIAEKMVAILCEKQRTNLTNAHPVLKKLFDMVINTIIKKYSMNTRPTSIPGVKEWNLNLLYSQITGTPFPTPPPPPADDETTDSESDSDASSVSSAARTSSSDEGSALPRNITFNLCTQYLIIMNGAWEIARFNNHNKGSCLRDWLNAVYDTKSDEAFIKYIREVAYITQQNRV
jgi:hypothetical protein